MKAKDEKELDNSLYWRVHHQRPRCPFCGRPMDFVFYVSYETIFREWVCPGCGCSLPDKVGYVEEELKYVRTERRKQLKRRIEEMEAYLAKLKEQLAQWGKYMSPKEKVKLLAEALEE